MHVIFQFEVALVSREFCSAEFVRVDDCKEYREVFFFLHDDTTETHHKN